MTLYIRMSTFSFFAVDAACPAGRTLKPMMIASEALARFTSFSVMPPTPVWMTFTFTCSVLTSVRALTSASMDPCTSALTTSLSSWTSPACIIWKRSSSPRAAVATFWVPVLAAASATSWAFLASVTL